MFFVYYFIKFYFQVKEKKYETVGTTSHMLANTMRIMAASSVSLTPFRNPVRNGSFMNTISTKKEDASAKNNPAKNNPEDKSQSSGVITDTGTNTGSKVVISNGMNQNTGRSPKSNQDIGTTAAPDIILSEDNNDTTNPKVPGSNPPSYTTTSNKVGKKSTSRGEASNKSEVTTVLLQPAMKNHVVYSIDSKPKHLVEGSAL